MQIVRSVLAVLAGMIAVVVLSEGIDFAVVKLGLLSFSGPDLTIPFAIATIYRSIAAVMGGYVTARLAPGAPMKHAIILGAIGTALALAGVIANLSAPNLWYPIALVITALPCSWLGGRLASSKA
jgi:hypothetical protein